jgi:hypothetical protein
LRCESLPGVEGFVALAVPGLLQSTVHSHGKIPSNIAIGNDISGMRMLPALNEFPQIPFLNLIWGFIAMFFAYKNPIESKLAGCDRP